MLDLSALADGPARPLAIIGLMLADIFLLWRLIDRLDLFGPQVTGRRLMTEMERRMIGYIERAVPGVRVHAQVSMSALIEPRRGVIGLARRRIFFSYAAKRVDYVLEDRRTGRIMALVELNDPSHNPDADRTRDRLTAAAGYLTIRLPAQERPTPQNVAARLQAVLQRDHQSEARHFG